MQLQFSWFLVSVLPVEQNAVKNILFRIASLFLNLTIIKVFAFLTFKSNAYTSYLMFSEDPIQKLLYIFSRGFSLRALLVLAFAVAMAVASLYDTLLWGLDSPGYVTQVSNTTADTVINQMLDSPSYIIFIDNPTQNLSNVNAEEAISGNLFKQGFNFTIPGTMEVDGGEVALSTQLFNDSGPRIWLDDEGFSVSFDQTTTYTTEVFCPTVTLDDNRQMWRCSIANEYALGFVSTSNPLGTPQIWWDNETDSQFFLPNRKDNPWRSLGTGGETGLMTQVFTVTKGNRRHTFLETAFKVSMYAANPPIFEVSELTDIIHRTWSVTPNDTTIDPTTQTLVDFVVTAQNTNGSGLTMGAMIREDHSVSLSYIELLKPINTVNVSSDLYSTLPPIYSFFRTSFVNITLIRSETLNELVTPFAPCNFSFSNYAYGGAVQGTSCYASNGNTTDAHFLGQIDSSSVLILSDILGNGISATSAVALNATGLAWYNANSDHMERLLVSRGYIMGGDASNVDVQVRHNVAAVSYLQLLLVVLPVFFAIMSVLLMLADRQGYYKSSFVAAVSATAHIGKSPCRSVGYISSPPELFLRSKGDHIVIETPSGGILSQIEENQEIGYVLAAAPLLGNTY